MADIHSNPSDRELAWFGVIMLTIFAVFGATAHWYFDSPRVAVVLWTAGIVLCAIFYLIVPLRRLLYLAWMRTFYPLSWLITRLLFGVIYFVVITPIGLVLRWSGYDPLQIKSTEESKSHWRKRPATVDRYRYFRQF